MELHYQIAGKYKHEARLIGSNTIKTGIELFGSSPPEEKNDFKKPDRDKNLPYWIIVGSKGILQGLLHEIRRFEFCKDVVILMSEKTPMDYIDYLKKRNYDFHIVGKEHVDLKKALELLYNKYNVKNLLTDCGRILSNLLIDQGLVNEISLLIHPIIVGDKSYNIFDNVNKKIQFKLLKNETLDEGHVWVAYQVLYSNKDFNNFIYHLKK